MLRYAIIVIFMMLPVKASCSETPLVFVSSSMPLKSIIQWSKQSNKIGAQMVLNGFIDNDFSKTISFMKKINELVGGVSFSIDPEAFERNKITKVPAVLYKDTIVYGDAGLN